MQCRLVSYKASMHIEFCQSATTYNYIVHRLTVIQHHQENINTHHDNPWYTNMQDHCTVLSCKSWCLSALHESSGYTAGTIEALTKPLLLKSNRTWHKHHADSLWKANQIITHGQTLEIYEIYWDGQGRVNAIITVEEATYGSILSVNNLICVNMTLCICICIEFVPKSCIAWNYDFNMVRCILTNRARIEFSGCWNRNTLSTIESVLAHKLKVQISNNPQQTVWGFRYSDQ